MDGWCNGRLSSMVICAIDKQTEYSYENISIIWSSENLILCPFFLFTASPTAYSKNFQNRETKIKIPQKRYNNLQQIPHFREFNIKHIIKIFKTLLLSINF